MIGVIDCLVETPARSGTSSSNDLERAIDFDHPVGRMARAAAPYGMHAGCSRACVRVAAGCLPRGAGNLTSGESRVMHATANNLLETE